MTGSVDGDGLVYMLPIGAILRILIVHSDGVCAM